jgi:hypothetical protein
MWLDVTLPATGSTVSNRYSKLHQQQPAHMWPHGPSLIRDQFCLGPIYIYGSVPCGSGAQLRRLRHVQTPHSKSHQVMRPRGYALRGFCDGKVRNGQSLTACGTGMTRRFVTSHTGTPATSSAAQVSLTKTDRAKDQSTNHAAGPEMRVKGERTRTTRTHFSPDRTVHVLFSMQYNE